MLHKSTGNGDLSISVFYFLNICSYYFQCVLSVCHKHSNAIIMKIMNKSHCAQCTQLSRRHKISIVMKPLYTLIDTYVRVIFKSLWNCLSLCCWDTRAFENIMLLCSYCVQQHCCRWVLLWQPVFWIEWMWCIYDGRRKLCSFLFLFESK